MKSKAKVLLFLLIAGSILLAAAVLFHFVLPQDSIQAFSTEPLLESVTLPTPPSVPETVPTVPTETCTQPAVTEPTVATVPEEEFILTFAGDCTFGAEPGLYYAQLGFIKTVGDDLEYPFRNVLSYFQDDDFTMVNLEGVLADRGSPVPKEFNFLGPVKFARILPLGSVEAVTLANNHTMDYGSAGYASTCSALQGENIPYVETNGCLMVTTRSGLTIGIYAMTYTTMTRQDMLRGIADLQSQGAELIIVAAHWGSELSYHPNDNQISLAHAAIDAGAHIVYGSHPHVLQPVEKYGDGIIYYSLGNFSFGGNGDPTDYDTALIRQQIIRTQDGDIVVGACTPIPACISSVPERNNYQPTPYPADSPEYQRVAAKLQGTYK